MKKDGEMERWRERKISIGGQGKFPFKTTACSTAVKQEKYGDIHLGVGSAPGKLRSAKQHDPATASAT
jgi:hypothetical protein